MRTSDDIAALAKALVAAQGEMKNAPLNRINPHFKSRYADLAGIRDAVTPALSKHGLAVSQATEFGENGFYLITRLMHGESGQWIESTYPLTHNPNPQAIGSQLTYARRYSLSAIAGISADDDDGEIAVVTNKDSDQTRITEEQVQTLQAAIIEADADLPRFLRWLRIENLSDMPAARYTEAMQKLAEKQTKKGAA